MDYTKGEWKAIQWNEDYGFNVFSDDGFVASVPMDKGLKHTMIEAKANALLISAAPDMYEACKQIKNYLLQRPAKTSELWELLTIVDKLTIKAEGKK